LTFATYRAATHEANVESKAALALILASGPLILTFA